MPQDTIPSYPDSCKVDFFEENTDSPVSWNKHGTALHFAFTGFGLGPSDAIAEAARAQRPDYAAWAEDADEFLDGSLPTRTFIAIRRDHQAKLDHTPVIRAEA